MIYYIILCIKYIVNKYNIINIKYYIIQYKEYNLTKDKTLYPTLEV